MTPTLILVVVQAVGAQYPLAPSPVLDLHTLTRELRLSGYVSARETLRRDTLTSMSDLASVLREQKQFEEARRLHRETLEIRRRVLGTGCSAVGALAFGM